MRRKREGGQDPGHGICDVSGTLEPHEHPVDVTLGSKHF